jgi:hypothetical protein
MTRQDVEQIDKKFTKIIENRLPELIQTATEDISRKGKSGSHGTNHVTNEVTKDIAERATQTKEWSGREDFEPPTPWSRNSGYWPSPFLLTNIEGAPIV